MWKERWRNPLMVLLVLCAFGYLGTLPLRFVPAAWETVSRAGDFIFIGVGLTVALGVAWLLDRVRNGRTQRQRLLIAAAITIVFASGVIAGWPSNQRLAQPRRIAVGGHTLDPPAVVAARMERAHARVRADRLRAGCRRALLRDDLAPAIADGRLRSRRGRHARCPDADGPMRALLRAYRTTLVVADRRTISGDNLFGFFFDNGPPALLRPATADKFDTAATNRLYDSGDLVIYGVRGLW